ncbi:MAG: HipA domain-containing protein [Sediminibacterium sp.]|nr:HipA domain-containing protein [Sediminibacterium sp.]
MNNCLFCYAPLFEKETDFHVYCSQKMFGQKSPPELPFSEVDLDSLAKEIIRHQTAVTGVQVKLSLQLSQNKEEGRGKRFTVVGLWGGYILKPPSTDYPQLPEVEDLTMRLAELADIKTVPHSLIRLKSGTLAYITRRIDRTKKGKLAMEDMCQLTQRLTEDKYRGSYEQIGKTILRYSTMPGLDLVNFFELVLFSFISGNADMHLKNFSLLEKAEVGMTLSPAYDLVNTMLVNPEDEEELALTLNGKKRKLKKPDFTEAMSKLGLDQKQQKNIFKKMTTAMPKWLKAIDQSFVTPSYKEQYIKILSERINRLL